jgi:hypothetical protein
VGKGKSRSYPEKEKDSEVQRLKNALKRKDKEMEKLKSELKTYEAAFQKNIQFLKGKTKDLSLQELLDGAKKEQNLKQIETGKEETYQEHKARWKCFVCPRETAGVMKITVLNRHDGKFYYRSCTSATCKHRTELKPFTDEVEIS